MSKFVAVGSGKGGVGKSTTTINIALSLATTGTKVAIVDLDPLSNITTILDTQDTTVETAAEVRLADISMRYAKNCDILFPRAKSLARTPHIVHTLFGTLHDVICAQYDIVLIDMPAGIADIFFVDLIPHVQHLLVVVVSEPTAHISAAGFSKAALQINPRLSLYFWHNKFHAESVSCFNSYTIIENYHQYVQETEYFTPQEREQCRNIAYIPHEQILDLLSTSLKPHEYIWFKIKEVLSFSVEVYIRSIAEMISDNTVIHEYITHYILEHHFHDGDLAQYMRALLSDFVTLQHSGIIPQSVHIDREAQRTLSHKLAIIARYPAYQHMRKCVDTIDRALAADALHSSTQGVRYIRVLEQKSIALLKIFDAHKEHATKSTRRCAILLSVYVSFSKILRNQQMHAFILQHIPLRQEEGQMVRDRRRQIGHLINKNAQLHQQHLQMVKKIYPIIIKQMMSVNSHYALSTLNFITTAQKLNVRAYLQLISHITHELIHCGLGVIVGITNSRTCASTMKGSKKILSFVSRSMS